MQSIKRSFSVLLALILVLSLGAVSAQAADTDLPRPGEYLFGGMERSRSYNEFRGDGWHPQNGSFNTEYAYILLSSTYLYELTSAHLVLKGDVEVIEAVVTYEDGTKFYGVRDYFADGEIVTVTIINPPVNAAFEIYLSCRLTNGNSGAVIAVCLNSIEESVAWEYLSWSTSVVSNSKTRPAGAGSLTEYFVFRTPGGEGWIFGFRAGMTVPAPRAGSVSMDPNNQTTPPPTEQPSSWAVEQVNAAIAAGLVPQSLQSKYTQTITRAEFCALAVALYEKYTGKEITKRKTFTDTKDVNVEKAAAINVVSGIGNNLFDPNANLTREQAAAMLSRLADAIDKPLTKQAATFADNTTISSWAIEAVGQVQTAGIMSGVGNNTFAPKDPYTREQSIITMIRLWNIVKP